MALSVIVAFVSASKSISYAKAKIAAVALANERMEIIKNMPYDDVGTTDSTYPPGIIPSTEEVVRKNINFVVKTDVRYRDDPFDGTIDSNPADLYPYDYKKVEIKIYWGSRKPVMARLTTNISASAAETESGTGILYFCAYDAENEPVPQATVDIINEELDPTLHIQITTEDNGCVMVPLLPPDEHNNYEIIVTKDNYTLAKTYPRTTQNPNQHFPHINILEQQVTEYSLQIDKVSTIHLSAVDQNDNPVPNINVNVRGTKEIQFNPVVYKYDQDHDLDSLGLLTLSDMEWDDYYFSVNTEGYFISSITPISPVFLNPATVLEVKIIVVRSDTNPQIISISPPDGDFGSTETLTISGDNFDNDAVVRLQKPSTGLEILGTDVSVIAGSEITVNFNLSSAEVGLWDVVVENPGGEYAKQENGFEVFEN